MTKKKLVAEKKIKWMSSKSMNTIKLIKNTTKASLRDWRNQLLSKSMWISLGQTKITRRRKPVAMKKRVQRTRGNRVWAIREVWRRNTHFHKSTKKKIKTIANNLTKGKIGHSKKTCLFKTKTTKLIFHRCSLVWILAECPSTHS